MLVGKAFDALQLHDYSLVHQKIRRIRPDMLAVVENREFSLLSDPGTAFPEFHNHRTLVNLLEEAAAQGIRDGVGGTYNRVFWFILFIGGHIPFRC